MHMFRGGGGNVWTPRLRLVRCGLLYWGLVGRKGGLKDVSPYHYLFFFLASLASIILTHTIICKWSSKDYMERSYLLHMSPFQIITKIQLPIPGFYERAFSDLCCPKLHHWSLRGPQSPFRHRHVLKSQELSCKFRNARSAFRNLHVDPLSFIPPWETNK